MGVLLNALEALGAPLRIGGPRSAKKVPDRLYYVSGVLTCTYAEAPSRLESAEI
jgi:hypothetical protein